jgi:hypothetical protein
MVRNTSQTDLRRRLASLRMKPRPGLWLARRANNDGGPRYYFQPSRFDATSGWKIVRLHDKNELPIRSEAEAEAACQKLAEIYLAWKQGKEGFGPEMIDRLGRPIQAHIKPSRTSAGAPGTITAIAADFMDSDEFSELKASTQDDYRLCLDALVKKFGIRLWQSISAKEAKAWIREKAIAHPSMASMVPHLPRGFE